MIADAREFIADFVPRQEEAERLASDENDDRVLQPSSSERETFRQLLEVREALNELELERTQLETSLKLAIGTAAGLDGIVSWKSHSVQRLDTEAFRLAEPVLYAKFLGESRSRTFRLLASRDGYAD